MELTSSRQNVHHNSARNVWLRDQIAPTVLAAINACPDLKRDIGAVLSKSAVATVFWTPVLEQIVARLGFIPCIKTEGGEFVVLSAMAATYVWML